MEVRQLRTFVCVAQLRSFTRAAAQLHIAQPALSRQIQKLEEELDVKLFEREARGVRMTDAGFVLQRKAEALFRDLHEMRTEVKGAGRAAHGHLTIAVPPAAGSFFLPRFLEKLRAELPMVSIHLLEGVSSVLQDWLSSERVDFAILHNAPPLPNLRVTPLVRERMCLIGPVGGVLDQPSCRLHDLQGLPLILPSIPHFNRMLIEQAALQYNLRLNVVLEVDGIGLTRELVAMGLGYAFMTQAGAAQKTNFGEIAVARLVAPQLLSELSLAYVNSVDLTAAHVRAIELMRETCAELLVAGKWPGAELA